MGEAALAREFKKQPPREPLDSITALWNDYQWRYVEAKRQDPCVYWTQKAPNLKTAIRRAVASLGEDGKMFFHQSMVSKKAKKEYTAILLKSPYYGWIKKAGKRKEFWFLMIGLRQAAKQTPGIGEVTVYDVGSRLGAYFGIEPEHLYFHAGVRMGLKALRVPIPSGVYCLERSALPSFFADKNLDLVESFLCGYRSEIERVMKLKDKKKRKKKAFARKTGRRKIK